MASANANGSETSPNGAGAGNAGDGTLYKVSSRLLRRRDPSKRPVSIGELDALFDTGRDSAAPTPRQAKPPIRDEGTMTKSYGITELRDNFFDAVFQPTEPVDLEDLIRRAEQALPYNLQKRDPLSVTNFLPKQWHDIKDVVRRVTRTRAGIKLLKSFLGVFIAHVLCLVPPIRAWLGRYSYIMVVSAILNHSGRGLGAQFEGLILTLLGTATGLGWGAFGLWLSTSTATARVGFGGIMAMFLSLYIFLIACLRSYYIRTYQAVICSGIAIIYTCLTEVRGTKGSWDKLLMYAIPWVLGQAIALIPCMVVAPDAGARHLAVALHKAFGVMLEGLDISRPEGIRTRRKLSKTFVELSQAYRDQIIDFSITVFDPKDVLQLRNLMQGVLRALLGLRSETNPLGKASGAESSPSDTNTEEFIVKVEDEFDNQETKDSKALIDFVTSNLVEPAENLVLLMKKSLQSCDATLMEMCGHRKYLGPPAEVSNDVPGSLVKLRKLRIAFGEVQEGVLNSEKLPPTYGEITDVVKLFAFCQSVHQAATAVEALLVRVNEMQQRQPRYPKFHPPSYPFLKSLYRSNEQVRHDRGGLTAGAYFRSFEEISRVIQRIKSKDFQPLPRKSDEKGDENETGYATMTADELEDESKTNSARLGHRIWKVMHKGQGFETRFALKTTAVTVLLSVPAWLDLANDWWDDYGVWWAVVMAWLIMAPRIGGNIQDLFTRVLCAVLGSVWGGLSYYAGDGNPYVGAVFALIFMLPMVYRYTQSSHPRSGLVGCISFTVVSLSAFTAQGQPSTFLIAATKGGAISIGVIASIVVNWILWPFVARHELRQGISSMMFHCSIVYRSIVSRYVYYDEGHEPTKEDIKASEVLEGRLREGFVRLRELLGLTRHEMRLRARFDPRLYSGLIDALEHFFEYVVTIRQSSLFYHPHFIRDNPEAAARLLAYRRDAIATVLTNLYVLSGALKAGRRVPEYLPNAALSRKALLVQHKALEAELADRGAFSSADDSAEASKKWSKIYNYLYNESLTGCVDQLLELERYTKAIVGEQGFGWGFDGFTST